jgi:hypothetical protein
MTDTPLRRILVHADDLLGRQFEVEPAHEGEQLFVLESVLGSPGALRAVPVTGWRPVEASDIEFEVEQEQPATTTTTTRKRGKREPKR